MCEVLRNKDIKRDNANALCDRWLIAGDFLLASIEGKFTHAIGNPPYVRQELIPDILIAEYQHRFCTIYDRADIYIPFIERSLSLLAPGGHLGFICADRWMKNRYGGPLRRLIAEKFNFKGYVDMVDTAAFRSEVIAYPAIVIISREKRSNTRVAFWAVGQLQRIDGSCQGNDRAKIGEGEARNRSGGVANGSEPWMLEAPDQLGLVRRLETAFPTLEEAGCKVGIGVATGADDVFIGLFDELDVEPDRKLPLAMTRDIQTGAVKWRGYGVINPFSDQILWCRSAPTLSSLPIWKSMAPQLRPAMFQKKSRELVSYNRPHLSNADIHPEIADPGY